MAVGVSAALVGMEDGDFLGVGAAVGLADGSYVAAVGRVACSIDRSMAGRLAQTTMPPAITMTIMMLTASHILLNDFVFVVVDDLRTMNLLLFYS